MLMVPMMIAYGILATPGIAFYVICITLIFFIPLVPVVLASILGTVIAYTASKFKHNNLLNIFILHYAKGTYSE
jgi:ABC-2 type transport system permease protein